MLTRESTADEILAHLRSLASEENRQGMLRYGIRIDRALGLTHGTQRDIARKIGRNHERAFELWASGVAEAQFIAALTADPARFTPQDARDWAADFDSWDIVDSVSDLFADTAAWRELIAEFAHDEREFVRRTAFAMLAWASVHYKEEPDETFADFLVLIEEYAADPRNFVRKAVNWALRAIGKRSAFLHAKAVATATRLAAQDDRTARWNGKDALRELTSKATLERIAAREARRAAKK